MVTFSSLRARLTRAWRQDAKRQNRPTARLSAEQLEAREVPAAFNFSFVLDESAGSFGLTTAQKNLFLNNVQAAGQLWASSLTGTSASPVTLEVQVVPDSNLGQNVLARAGSNIYLNVNGHAEPGALYEARTGTDPNGSTADITIRFDPTYLQTFAFFDPAGINRSSNIPSNETDVISVTLHELGHGLGIVSSRNSSGVIPPGFLATTFDTLISGNVFVGAQAQTINGGAVPLSADYSHLNISGDLMFPSIPRGFRATISAVDRAVLQDIGWAPVTVSTATISTSTTFTLDAFGNLYRQFSGGSYTLMGLSILEMEAVQGQLLFVRDAGNNLYRYNTAAGSFEHVAFSVIQIGKGEGQFFALNAGNNLYRYNGATGGFDLIASAVIQIGRGQGRFFALNGANNLFRYNGATGGFDLIASAVLQIGSSQGELLARNAGNNVYRYNNTTSAFDIIASGITQMETSQGLVFVLDSANNLFRYNAGGFQLSVGGGTIADIWTSNGLFYIQRTDGAVFRYVFGLGDYLRVV